MGQSNKNLVDGGVSDTKVYIAPIKSIISYQIIEEELSQVESGFDRGICLNIAIACLSASLSLLATVLATSFEQGSYAKPILSTLAITLLVFSFIFLCLYFSSRKKSKGIFERIRSRKSDIPLPVVQEKDEKRAG